MTKSQEIEILREAASKLGADSYLGPWLLQLLPELEAHMRADVRPMITVADAIEYAQGRAELEADRIIRFAQTEAAKAKADAEKYREQARGIAGNLRHSGRELAKIQESIARLDSLLQ
jgi:hypothetical protein